MWVCFKWFIIFINFIYVYASVCIDMCEWGSRSIGCPGIGLQSCELPDVRVGIKLESSGRVAVLLAAEPSLLVFFFNIFFLCLCITNLWLEKKKTEQLRKTIESWDLGATGMQKKCLSKDYLSLKQLLQLIMIIIMNNINTSAFFLFSPVLHQSQENFMKCQNVPNQKKLRMLYYGNAQW